MLKEACTILTLNEHFNDQMCKVESWKTAVIRVIHGCLISCQFKFSKVAFFPFWFKSYYIQRTTVLFIRPFTFPGKKQRSQKFEIILRYTTHRVYEVYWDLLTLIFLPLLLPAARYWTRTHIYPSEKKFYSTPPPPFSLLLVHSLRVLSCFPTFSDFFSCSITKNSHYLLFLWSFIFH